MGQEKRKRIFYTKKKEEATKWFEVYFSTLENYLRLVPYQKRTSMECLIGRCELHLCRDGVLAIIYDTRNVRYQIDVISESTLTGSQLMPKTSINNFRTAYGKPYDWSKRESSNFIFRLQGSSDTNEPSKSGVVFGAGAYIYLDRDEDPNPYYPAWSKAFLIGWNSSTDNARKTAQEDWEKFAIEENIAKYVSDPRDLEKASQSENVVKLKNIITKFSNILEDNPSEGLIQKFLNDNPWLIYPENIFVKPQFQLGSQYKADYLFIAATSEGVRHVFVEIEHSGKPIFTKNSQFTADFTQAKNQLLDWEHWCNMQISYLNDCLRSQKIPTMYKPAFHLIMGRDKTFSEDEKLKIQTEFSSTSRIFSTYDDLIKKVEAIIKNYEKSA